MDIITGDLFDVVLFDCDGVLWQSSEVLPGAAETLRLLRSNNVEIKLITNSSTKSRETLHDKVVKLGLDTVKIQDCFPSGVCAAHYLKSSVPSAKSIYVIGEQGLVDELQRVGFEVVGGPDHNESQMTDSVFVKLGNESSFRDIDAVVVGYDQHFNFYKLCCASLACQQNPNCVFVATNDDQHDRIGGKWLIPANGCALEAVTHAVNGLDGQQSRMQPVVVGKPNKLFGELVLQASGLGHIDPARVLMIGDKIETDIRLAKNCGFKSCLVLSGCSKLDDLKRFDTQDQPDYVFNGLFELANFVYGK